MNRNLSLFLLSLALVQSAHAAGSQPSLYVQVRNTKLRQEAKFWSAQAASLDYGAVVSPISAASTDKSWLKVKFGTIEGYVHISAVTKRRIVLSGQKGPANQGVDQSSIVLAGKGFNNQVESKFGAARGLDFSTVDEVEKLSVDGAEEALFVTEGKLNS